MVPENTRGTIKEITAFAEGIRFSLMPKYGNQEPRIAIDLASVNEYLRNNIKVPELYTSDLRNDIVNNYVLKDNNAEKAAMAYSLAELKYTEKPKALQPYDGSTWAYARSGRNGLKEHLLIDNMKDYGATEDDIEDYLKTLDDKGVFEFLYLMKEAQKTYKLTFEQQMMFYFSFYQTLWGKNSTSLHYFATADVYISRSTKADNMISILPVALSQLPKKQHWASMAFHLERKTVRNIPTAIIYVTWGHVMYSKKEIMRFVNPPGGMIEDLVTNLNSYMYAQNHHGTPVSEETVVTETRNAFEIIDALHKALTPKEYADVLQSFNEGARNIKELAELFGREGLRGSNPPADGGTEQPGGGISGSGATAEGDLSTVPVAGNGDGDNDRVLQHETPQGTANVVCDLDASGALSDQRHAHVIFSGSDIFQEG